MAGQQLVEHVTAVHATIGGRRSDPLTLGELRDAIAWLLTQGYPEDTPVHGSAGMYVHHQLPPMTPAQVCDVLAGGPV